MISLTPGFTSKRINTRINRIKIKAPKRRKGIIVMSMTKLVLFTIILAVLIGVTSIAASYLNKLSDNFSPFEMEPEVKDSMYGLACAINSVAGGEANKTTCPNWYAEENKIFLTAPHVIKNLITGFTIGKKQYSIIKEGEKTTINYRSVQVVCDYKSSTTTYKDKKQRSVKPNDNGDMFGRDITLGKVTGRATSFFSEEELGNKKELGVEEESKPTLTCKVLHFSLPQRTGAIDKLLSGYHAPKYVLFYEGFPPEEMKAWELRRGFITTFIATFGAGVHNLLLNLMTIVGGAAKDVDNIMDAFTSERKAVIRNLYFSLIEDKDVKQALVEVIKEDIMSKRGLDSVKASELAEDIVYKGGAGIAKSSPIYSIAHVYKPYVDMLSNVDDNKLAIAIISLDNRIFDLLHSDPNKKLNIDAVLEDAGGGYEYYNSLSSKEKKDLLTFTSKVVNYYVSSGVERVKEINKQIMSSSKNIEKLIPDDSIMDGVQCPNNLKEDTCRVIAALAVSDVKDRVRAALLEPVGINRLGLYMPDRLLYSAIYLGRRTEVIKLNTNVRDKYIILDKATLGYGVRGNGKVDNRDSSFYLVSPCKATLSVSLSRWDSKRREGGLANTVHACTPWVENLDKITGKLKEKYAKDYNWNLGEKINYFCSEEFIEQNIMKDFQERYKEFCSCIADETYYPIEFISNIDEGVEVNGEYYKKIGYDPDECEKWLKDPAIIYTGKEKESWWDKFKRWVLGESQKKSKVIAISRRDLNKLLNDIKRECYEYDPKRKGNGYFYVNKIGISKDKIPSKFNKPGYFCFKKLGLGEEIGDDSGDNMIFKQEMCNAIYKDIKECNLYFVSKSQLSNIKDIINKGLEKTRGMCFPAGQLALEMKDERERKQKKYQVGMKSIDEGGVPQYFKFLYVAEPLIQANGKLIVIDSIPKGIYSNAYFAPILEEGDKGIKRAWMKERISVIDRALTWLGVDTSRLNKYTIHQDAILISLIEKEKTKGENYCYMPNPSRTRMVLVHIPGFILNIASSLLLLEANPAFIGTSFISGALTEVLEQKYIKNDIGWPSSWDYKYKKEK